MHVILGLGRLFYMLSGVQVLLCLTIIYTPPKMQAFGGLSLSRADVLFVNGAAPFSECNVSSSYLCNVFSLKGDYIGDHYRAQ